MASNRLLSISGLRAMEGPGYKLRVVDFSDNSIADFNEVSYLGGLTSLKEATFVHEETGGNPMCKIAITYYGKVLQLPNIDSLQVDGKTKIEIVNDYQQIRVEKNQKYKESVPNQGVFSPLEPPSNLKNTSKKPNRPNSDSSSLNNRQPRFQNYTRPIRKSSNSPPFRARDVKLNSKNRKEEGPFRDVSPGTRLSQLRSSRPDKEVDIEDLERVYRRDILELQNRLEETTAELSDVIFKFECNEKFWVSKLFSIEEINDKYRRKNESLSSSLNSMENDLSLEREKNERLEGVIATLHAKKEKKEGIVDSLQNKITVLMEENSILREQTRQFEETQRALKGEKDDLEREIGQLRAVLRENEKTLSSFHSKSLEENSGNIRRLQEIQMAYDALAKEHEERSAQCSLLASRVHELANEHKDKEVAAQLHLKDLVHNYENRIKDLEREIQDQKAGEQDRMEKKLNEREERFKNSMDLIEEEFKKVLLETNEKLRRTKQTLEEQTSQQRNFHEAIRFREEKIDEQDKMILELNNMLVKAKDQVAEREEDMKTLVASFEKQMGQTLKEKEQLLEEIERIRSRNSSTGSKIEKLEEEINEQMKEISALKKEKTKLSIEKEEIESDLKRIGSKFSVLEERMQEQLTEMRTQLIECEEDLKLRSSEYQDKCEEVEQLRSQIMAKEKEIRGVNEENEVVLRQKEGAFGELERELVKYKGKVHKKKELIQEYEEEISSLKEEVSAARQEAEIANAALEQKKQMIDAIVEEVEALRQEREEENLRDKERIRELEELTKEIEEALEKKIKRVKELEEELREIHDVYRVRLESQEAEAERQRGETQKAILEAEKIAEAFNEKEKEVSDLRREMERKKQAFQEQMKRMNEALLNL